MTDKLKKGIVTLTGDKPMRYVEDDSLPDIVLTPEQETRITRLGEVFKAYRKASKELIEGKYKHLRNFVPSHLNTPGNLSIVLCYGGIVVRHERFADASKIYCGWIEGNLGQAVALLSQNLIYCHDYGDFENPEGVDGVDITCSIFDAAGVNQRDLFKLRVKFDVDLSSNFHQKEDRGYPFSIASVGNYFEISLQGAMASVEEPNNFQQPFVTRSQIRLGVGWEYIEIFATEHVEKWDDSKIVRWAENDILAAVAAAQVRDAYFQTLDPMAGARKAYRLMLAEFQQLLDSAPEREEVLQVFLKNNPIILCPAFTKMWPKLPLGAKDTDFVFRDAIGDYLLVELENSTDKLFRKDGHPLEALRVAQGQISDWKRYIEDNIKTVQDELGLAGISSNPRSLIVIGRDSYLSIENKRKLTTMENENPKSKVMTYDDLYQNAKSIVENLFGPLLEASNNTEIYYVQDGQIVSPPASKS